jgi:hypothetical protein
LAAFSQKNRLKCTVSCAKQSEKPGQVLKPSTRWIEAGDASGPVHHIAIAIFSCHAAFAELNPPMMAPSHPALLLLAMALLGSNPPAAVALDNGLSLLPPMVS